MKKTQRKDALRNIQRQIVSFLSIVIVVALGVGVFLSCLFSSRALAGRASEFYRQASYRDIEVRSTTGITEEDVACAAALEGVSAAEGIFALDMVMKAPGGESLVHVISRTEEMDRFAVESGKAPEAANECAVVPELAEAFSLSVGDKISIRGKTEVQSLLSPESFVITGIVRHPDHYRKGVAATYNVIITPEAVDPEKAQIAGTRWTGMLIRADMDIQDTFSAAWRSGIDALSEKLRLLGDERAKIRDEELAGEAEAVMSEGERQLAEGKEKLDAMEKDILALQEKLQDEHTTVLEAGMARVSLATLNMEYAVGKASYDSGLEQLELAREKLAELGSTRWILLPRYLNLTFSEVRETQKTFQGIGTTFALLFIFLSALVCYATIGKIIEDQRKLVGTTRALGFTRREIFLKYLIFGTGASCLGVIFGLLLVYFLMESIMLGSSGQIFLLGGIPKVFLPVPAILAMAVAAAISLIAVWAACRRLLAEPAVDLLSGAVPQPVNRKKGAKRSRSLYAGLILRNVVSDWKRVMVTVVSIAGCCMLLITGFSLRQSFVEVIRRQFTEIIGIDAQATFLTGDGGTALAEGEQAVREAGAQALPMTLLGLVYQAEEGGEALQLVCADPEELEEYYHLTDAKDGSSLRLPDTGAVIFNRLAEVYGLKAGDTITVMDGTGVCRDIPVAGVYKCYAGRTIYMSSQYAGEVFGTGAAANTLAVRFADRGESPQDTEARKEELKEKLSGISGFLGYTGVEEMRARYETTVRMMNIVIAATTVMAAIMAAVVLLNLVRIQMNQKKREMTIMRVNGFTMGETAAYILRENVVTTLAGIVLGLVVGYLAAWYILRTIDRVELMMIRDFMPSPGLYSALITLVFAALVNAFALREIRKLKLADAAG